MRDLTAGFHLPQATIRANYRVSFSVSAGTILGIVGESGSGKSVLLRTMLRLIPSPPGFISEGAIMFEGRDLLRLSEEEMRQVRGTAIAMIFQNPMTSLNPVWPIGDQITEGLRVHDGLNAREARERGIGFLRQVGIPAAEARFNDYPFQWSGGMLQRAAIAMAMGGRPKLLLADEPTTALDVTIQDQILALLVDLQVQTGMAVILVSHDMAVVAETCDELAVMYAGRIMETGRTAQLFANPRHPYTLGLLESIPRIDTRAERLRSIPGQPPNLAETAVGCPFAPRCRFASADCRTTPIALREVEPGHRTACLYPERIDAGG